MWSANRCRGDNVGGRGLSRDLGGRGFAGCGGASYPALRRVPTKAKAPGLRGFPSREGENYVHLPLAGSTRRNDIAVSAGSLLGDPFLRCRSAVIASSAKQSRGKRSKITELAPWIASSASPPRNDVPSSGPRLRADHLLPQGEKERAPRWRPMRQARQTSESRHLSGNLGRRLGVFGVTAEI